MQRYQAKVSGPILDRIDLRVEVGVLSIERLVEAPVRDVDATRQLRERIAAARARQAARYSQFEAVHCNAQVGPEQRRSSIQPRREAAAFLRRAVARWILSLRAYDRTLAVARTIADLDGASDVDAQHVAEALQYRLPQP